MTSDPNLNQTHSTAVDSTVAPFTVTVASGKGGVGKTTIAVLIARLIADRGPKVAYVDCDVEAPNGHLLLRPAIKFTQSVTRLIPAVDESRCEGCGVCEATCEFGAIVALAGGVKLSPNMCLSCGACVTACPNNALGEVEHKVGETSTGTAGRIHFGSGQLRPGEARSIPLIQAVTEIEFSDIDIVIRDGPPGTACPAVTALEGSDLVVLVTDATPFGLNDLSLIVDTVNAIGLPSVVTITRSDHGDDRVAGFCERNDLPIMGRIPFSRSVSEAYSSGDTATFQAELKPHLENLVRMILTCSKQIVHA